MTALFSMHTITLLTTLSITRACNYVGPASWFSFMGEESINEPEPVGFCVNENLGNLTTNGSTSRMFLCAPWSKPYLFTFHKYNCEAQNFQDIIPIESGDYKCNSQELCDIFFVETSIPAGASCAPNTDDLDQFITLANQCHPDIHTKNGQTSYSSVMTSCTPEGDVEYKRYDGVLDCSGEAASAVIGHDGECSLDEGVERHITLLGCGEQQSSVDYECSFVRGANWTEYEYSFDDITQQLNVEVKTRTNDEARPMGPDICIQKYDNGSFYSELWFCSDALQMGFVAEWNDRDEPSKCDTEPDEVRVIEDADELECNQAAGPCPYIHMRSAEFEDIDGDGECTFPSDRYEEIVFVVSKCWDDGDEAGKATCNDASITYTSFDTLENCESDMSGSSKDLSNNMCYDFEGDEWGAPQSVGTPGNYTYFELLQCGDTVVNPRPNCRFVENAMWYAQDRDYDHHEGHSDGFREPIGICISKEGEGEAESYMFLCPPFDATGVVVVVWNDVDCQLGGELRYITEVIYTDYECNGYCDNILIMDTNKVDDPVTGCVQNDSAIEQMAFITGCTDGARFESDRTEFVSTNIECTPEGQIIYEMFDGPGCVGTPKGSLDVDTASVTPCALVGESEAIYIDMIQCGANNDLPDDVCSYIVNPVWNGSNISHDSDGAVPLTTQICLSDYEHEMGSRMYFCDYHSSLAFVAIWYSSHGCAGFPDELEIIESAVGEMVCASDDVSNCDYVLTSTGQVSVNEECLPVNGIGESARVLDKCWPSEDNKGTVTSWKVDCLGDTLMIEKFNGGECNGDATESIVVNDGECAYGVGDAEDRTYFGVQFCSKAPPTTTGAENTDVVVVDTQTTTDVGVGEDLASKFVLKVNAVVVITMVLRVIAT